MKPFSAGDLAVLYERAIDLDGNLLLLALESCDQLNYITESLTLLFMVQDEEMRRVAIVYFLH